jgi:hypothetical protein
MAKKTLKLKLDKKGIAEQLQQEIQDEYIEEMKERAKEKMKSIRRLEIQLKKEKEELKDMLNGEKFYTEEDMLF